MKDLNMVFAGFGGQGVLFAGKVAAYAGLLENKGNFLAALLWA